MAFKRVMLSIDSDLNEHWNEIAKRHKVSKSGMVEDYLSRALPVLEKTAPVLQVVNESLDVVDTNTKSLFD